MQAEAFAANSFNGITMAIREGANDGATLGALIKELFDISVEEYVQRARRRHCTQRFRRRLLYEANENKID